MNFRAPRLVLLAIVAAVLVGTAAVVGAAGFDLSQAARALLQGAFGSWYAIGSGTLVRATPLVLTGLSVAIAFRAGVFNIGAEGQFLVGAAAAVAVALALTGTPPIVVVPALLLAGAVAGGVWAAIAAWLRARFHVLEVISTILLNFVAAYLVSYLVRGPLQEPQHIFPQTATISVAAQLPRFGPTTRLHIGFLIAVVACAVTWWAIRFTAAGFRVRLVGSNPDAARTAGLVNTTAVTTRSFVLSGAIAGLAGSIELAGVTYALYENISPGYGYTAIAVALLARLDPLGVIATGIAFGALEAGATAMQRDAGVPSVLVTVVEASIILVLVALERVRVGTRAAA